MTCKAVPRAAGALAPLTLVGNVLRNLPSRSPAPARFAPLRGAALALPDDEEFLAAAHAGSTIELLFQQAEWQVGAHCFPAALPIAAQGAALPVLVPPELLLQGQGMRDFFAHLPWKPQRPSTACACALCTHLFCTA